MSAGHKHIWRVFAKGQRQCVVCSTVQMKVDGKWAADLRRFFARWPVVD